MYAEVAWVLVSSGTQVQPQVILDPDYLRDDLSVSYDYALIHVKLFTENFCDIAEPYKLCLSRYWINGYSSFLS